MDMPNDLLRELPMGFGMALAANTPALRAFADLPREAQLRVLAGTHAIRSKDEMRAYVERLTQ